jgi:hypothetical protein
MYKIVHKQHIEFDFINIEFYIRTIVTNHHPPMNKFFSLLLGTLVLSSVAVSSAGATSIAEGPAQRAGLPEAVSILPPAFKAKWRKTTLHRPNYTYYKGDKKRKGLLSFLPFGKN